MHGTDVVFLGVSVDEAKENKQKWLDFIETEGLKGIQLLANGWSKITKDYKINGIPRFMVFDKKGNIVSSRCSPALPTPNWKKCWKRNSTDNPLDSIQKIKGCPAFTLFSSPLSLQSFLSSYFQKLKSVQKKLYRHSFCFA